METFRKGEKKCEGGEKGGTIMEVIYRRKQGESKELKRKRKVAGKIGSREEFKRIQFVNMRK